MALHVNVNNCSCAGGYVVRLPWSTTNANWVGIGGGTCGQPSQSMTVTFKSASSGGSMLTAQNGDWDDTLTWVGHVVPTLLDEAVIRHRVNVDPSMGAIAVDNVKIINSISDGDLEIRSGTTFTVTEDMTITLGNFGNYGEILVTDASDLVVGGDITLNRLTANVNSETVRLQVLNGSSVSCTNFGITLKGTGGSNQSELYMANSSTMDVSNNFSASNAGGRSAFINIDSSNINVGVNSCFNLTDVNGGDLIFRTTGTSLYDVTDRTYMNHRGGDDMSIQIRGESVVNFKNRLNELHDGGDAFSLTVQDEAELNVTGATTVTQSAGSHTNSFIGNSRANFTGAFNTNKTAGTTTVFRTVIRQKQPLLVTWIQTKMVELTVKLN